MHKAFARSLALALVSAMLLATGVVLISASHSRAAALTEITQIDHRDPPRDYVKKFAKRVRHGKVRLQNVTLRSHFKGKPKKIKRALARNVNAALKEFPPGSRARKWDGWGYIEDWLTKATCVSPAPLATTVYEKDVCQGHEEFTIGDINEGLLVSACFSGAAVAFKASGFWVGVAAAYPCADQTWDGWTD